MHNMLYIRGCNGVVSSSTRIFRRNYRCRAAGGEGSHASLHCDSQCCLHLSGSGDRRSYRGGGEEALFRTIIGPHASELIAEAALVLQNGLTASQLAHTPHVHSTFSEALKEAALALSSGAIHR